MESKGIPNMQHKVANIRMAYHPGMVNINDPAKRIVPTHSTPTGINAMDPIKGKANTIRAIGIIMLDKRTIATVDVIGSPIVHIISVNTAPKIIAIPVRMIANTI